MSTVHNHSLIMNLYGQYHYHAENQEQQQHRIIVTIDIKCQACDCFFQQIHYITNPGNLKSTPARILLNTKTQWIGIVQENMTK